MNSLSMEIWSHFASKTEQLYREGKLGATIVDSMGLLTSAIIILPEGIGIKKPKSVLEPIHPERVMILSDEKKH